MDKQDAFNKIYKHLIAQGRPSKWGRKCMYRSPDGLKCAIGALIPDEDYSPRLESNTVDTKIVADTLRVDRDDRGVMHFLQALQDVHDLCPPEDWAYYLRDVAWKYGLQVPECE